MNKPDEPTEASRRRRGWTVWSRWVLANAVSGSIASFAGLYVTSAISPGGVLSLVVVVAAIAGTWAVVGMAQWRVLQNQVQKARAWVLADVVGGSVGSVLGLWIATGWWALFTVVANPSLLAIGVAGIVAGAVVGVAQWRVLRDRIQKARAWVLAGAVSGCVGWVVGWGLSSDLGSFTGSAAGWAAGAAITGIALVQLLPDFTSEL